MWGFHTFLLFLNNSNQKRTYHGSGKREMLHFEIQLHVEQSQINHCLSQSNISRATQKPRQ